MEEADIKVFCIKEINELKKVDPLVKKVIEDFTAYQEGNYISYFGRNAPIHQPKPDAELAGLMHLHLLSQDKYKDLNVLRFKDRYGLTGDSFLMYTTGFLNPNHYCILDYIRKDAHEKVRDLDYVRGLIAIAEKFRKSR